MSQQPHPGGNPQQPYGARPAQQPVYQQPYPQPPGYQPHPGEPAPSFGHQHQQPYGPPPHFAGGYQPAGYQGPWGPPATPQSSPATWLSWVGIGAALVQILGGFLPWITSSLQTAWGYQGDGLFLIAFGVIAVALGLIRFRRASALRASAYLGAGLLGLVVCSFTFYNLQRADLRQVLILYGGGPGAGLMLCASASVILLVLGLLGLFKKGSL